MKERKATIMYRKINMKDSLHREDSHQKPSPHVTTSASITDTHIQSKRQPTMADNEDALGIDKWRVEEWVT